ncbi:MAG: dihydroorotate dehydrogenase, partial [Spirochaetaceae bacterium]|nr:dihydroorotate dehydrogenase [Spirochaetaceae bacterium]MCF7952172.1 dihydroorotate dehydrogenase [Spirochaetaceae bacterium]
LIKVLLAGADVVQMVSALYSHSIVIVPKMLGELKEWMGDKNYKSVKDFQGKLSYANNSKPEIYTRAQYARALLHPEKYILTGE